MNRRSFLVAAGVGASAALAGCSGSGESPPDELADAEADPDQLPAPSLGAGPVPIDVYEDFGCPACHQFEAQVFPVLEQGLIDPDEVTYRHVDFPIPAHDRSFAMANAARAVQDDTRTDDDPTGAFFAYKERVLAAGEDGWDEAGLAAVAEEVDADPDAVTTALEEEAYYPTLVADWQRGVDDGVSATPTVVVDGTTVEDPFDVEEIATLVQDAQ